jgi:ACT domain-containing protein
MAEFHLQIALPDRPGSLGSVASAIGFAGGDIRKFTVVSNDGGKGIDDVVVAIPGNDPTDLLNVLGQIGGVEVLSIELLK